MSNTIKLDATETTTPHRCPECGRNTRSRRVCACHPSQWDNGYDARDYVQSSHDDPMCDNLYILRDHESLAVVERKAALERQLYNRVLHLLQEADSIYDRNENLHEYTQCKTRDALTYMVVDCEYFITVLEDRLHETDQYVAGCEHLHRRANWEVALEYYLQARRELAASGYTYEATAAE